MTDESKLIFIISQPRSGSTLLQKLISNNESVDTVSEPWLLLPLLSVYKPELVSASYNYPVALTGFFDYLKKKEAEDEFRQGLKKLILGLYKVKTASQFFVDKTPRYYEIIPEIASLFPQAKFLILKRNPFASLHSMLSTWSGGGIDYKLFGTFYRDFLKAPFLIQDFCEKNGSQENVRIVRYEEIVSAPEKEVSALYKWLGIPFDAAVLDVGRNEKVKGIYGDDVYKSKPLQGIQGNHSEAWKDSLSDKDLLRFYSDYQEYLSAGFLRSYGYAEEKFNSGSFRFGRSRFPEYIATLKKSGQL